MTAPSLPYGAWGTWLWKEKWVLGSSVKTKLSKNRKSRLGGLASKLPAWIRICKVPSVGGRKHLVADMWEVTDVSPSMQTHTHTHVHEPNVVTTGQEELNGPQPGSQWKPLGGGWGVSKDGLFFLPLWVGSCWKVLFSTPVSLLESWPVTGLWKLVAPWEREKQPFLVGC